MTLRLELKEQALRKRLQKVTNNAANAKSIRVAFERTLAGHQRAVIDRFSPFSLGGSPDRDHLFSRSGNLKKGIGFRIKGRGLKTLQGIGFASGKQAELQEYGGTVKPKTKKWLTIPLPSALTPAGRLKGKYLIKGRGKNAMDAGPSFFFAREGEDPKTADTLFIGIRKKRTRKLKKDEKPPMDVPYVMKKSVEIKPRLKFYRTWRTKTRELAVVELRRALREIVKR